MSDPIKEAAANLLEQLHAKVQAVKETTEMQDVLKLHRALNALEELTQGAPTTLAAVFGLGAEMVTAGSGVQRLQLKPWEFTGLPPLEAAKLYLKKVGEPKMVDEIVAAINEHGGNAGSVDHLKTSLTRSTLEIVKVPGKVPGRDDRYGLLEHFPHIKRTGKPKKKAGATNGTSQPAEEEAEQLNDEDTEREQPSPDGQSVASMLPADMIDSEDDENSKGRNE